jgi:methyl-accepting chemotaxis protein
MIDLIGQSMTLWSEYRQHLDVILAPNADVVSNLFYDATLAIDDSFAPLAKSTTLVIQRLKSESEGKIDLLKQILGVTILVTLLLAISTWLQVRRTIVRPICELAAGIRRMRTDSDLTQRVPVRSSDEIGELATNFNSMSEEFRSVLGEFISTADRIDREVESLSAVVNQTKDDVVQQHIRLENIATAMNEMATSANSVIESTGIAVEATNRSADEASRGRSEARNSTKVLDTMVKSVRSTAGQIQKLEQDAQSIGAIVDVIRGIADQTNLLALNAAIEAARAGEQGRGFAVVAEEVRSLAQRTQQSTGEIQNMIGKLQANTEQAVAEMNGGEAHANNSVSHMQTLLAALEEITQSIQEVNGLNASIAVAAQQQGEVSHEISRSITEVSDSVGQSSRHAEQTSVTSAALSELSSGLRQIIHGFKI